MNSIDKLIEIFRQFPGIGPRQAKRFVYFLMTRNSSYLVELSSLIQQIKKEIRVCESCQRFYTKNLTDSDLCGICANKNRDMTALMVVSRDVDFETIEKSKVYDGFYFILGGTIPILDTDPSAKIRQKELLDIISKRKEIKEIILATNLNPEGENTAEYIEKLLSPIAENRNIKISHLGRGLSTGTELEYSDTETIKNALKNRN